jgi:hypothetical protein
MSRFAIFLPLLTAVEADYIMMANYFASTTCDGNPFMVTVLPGCSPLTSGSVQYQCTSTTGATMSTYSSQDCSGTPEFSMNATQFTFGCDSSSSMETTCKSGDYDLGSAVATFMYNNDQCPPTADPQAINTIPCGSCIDFGDGQYQQYDCNATAYTVGIHNTEDCTDYTGLSMTTELSGCSVVEGTTSVDNQVCTDAASRSGSLEEGTRVPDANQKAKLADARSKMHGAQAKALAAIKAALAEAAA